MRSTPMTGSFLSSLALTGHPLPFPAAHHPQQHVDVQLPDHNSRSFMTMAAVTIQTRFTVLMYGGMSLRVFFCGNVRTGNLFM